MDVRTRFRALLQAKGWSQEKAAAELQRQLETAYEVDRTSCTQSWLSAILLGSRRPTLELAIAIRDVSMGTPGGAIEPADWLPRRRRPSKPIRRAA